MIIIYVDFCQYLFYKELLIDYSKLIINGLVGNLMFYYGVLKVNMMNYQQVIKFLIGCYVMDIYYDKKLNVLIEIY